MKKIFAIVALAGAFTFGMVNTSMAQDETEAPAAEQVDSTAAAQDEQAVEAPAQEEAPAAEAEAEPQEEEVSMHKALKTKYIEGGAGFMSLVAIALVVGLAFCIERVVYLSLCKVNYKTLLARIQELVEKGNLEGAIDLCNETRGPVAEICKQALINMKDGKTLDVVDKTITTTAAVQSSYLEQNCSWITFFIASAPSLGFLGTVIGMVLAFDNIQKAGDISPTVVAGGMKVALITTIFGIVVALILQLFYNIVLAMIETLVSHMEDSSIRLIEIYTINENRKK
ncbi:MAG: MotA/TolQ/ExbB proton channel family protein [Bacteroidaceae bacterium]|nr:MotA/TolQ/ExbB proton channel family protein [Bacteroidaceae bacterium]